PYSKFVQAVREDRFSRVVISKDWVKGYLAGAPRAEAEEEKPAANATRPLPPGAGANVRLPWLANRVSDDQGFVQLLQSKNIEYEAQPDSPWTDLLWIWVLPIGLGLLLWSFMLRRMGGQMGQGPPGIMTFGKTRARIHSESDTGISFKDVAGVDEAVDELKEIVEFLKTPEKYRRLGGKVPKGVLLVGPPGTGKTLLARAIAGEAGVPFFSLTGSEFVEMFVGVGAARVRDLFQQAQQKAPCIVFIDELDAIGKSRNANVIGGHDEREQTLNQLLAEMDGFDSKVGLIVLAATHRPEMLDAALLRPGRFVRQVLVDRADRRGRERILEIHARDIKLGPDVNLKALASHTPGFAGADLANVCNEAALLAARRNSDFVQMRDFEEAVERVVAGLEKKNRRMNEHEKQIVAFHESGHAVVGWMLPHAERVHKVSIIPRGLGALGYTLQMPLEDRYLMSYEELRDKVSALMGGRASEEIFIGSVSTGASNDLKQATDIAKHMVRDYGMSQAQGPVNLSENSRSAFLGGAASGPELRNYSEQTAEAVDREVRRIVQEGLERARRVLGEHRGELQRLAAQLLITEVVDADELARILGEKVRVPSPLAAPHADQGTEVRPQEPFDVPAP
ncbi:MAG: ATP-dependent zinc metalloprotease FtsH, partial [Deltaproteobacteria bacterium]|nr:ATP-dependent zinc metalloprotease FtsH [Deltaproteobacteria bacterium]